MRLTRIQSMVGLSLCTALLGTGLNVADDDQDFGLKTEHQLKAHSEQLFGITQPLEESALGPYAGLESSLAVNVAKGLKVTVVSNATHSQNDMMVLWPNDHTPTHIIIAVESGASTPCVQVVDLKGNPNSNVRTILQGLIASDPIRRTPWGTILVAEEASDGGLYEILDPLQITTPVLVTNRATGATTDPSRVVKRKAIGALAFEGIGILANGTTYYGDELRPGNGAPGGAIFKFVPHQPYFPGSGPISNLAASPLAGGTIYGLRLGTRNGNTDFGQGSEVGKGSWRLVQTVPDANGNVSLRSAQAALGLTGYYRPEDLEVDPIAAAEGIVRVCWANTGIMSNGDNSAVENNANYGEILSLVDEPALGAASGSIPLVTRFFAGDPDANHFDNLAFQPKTGNLAICEDGEVEVVKPNGQQELRGNDIWLLLRDGADRNVQSDGAIKILSLKDTDSETTGIIFDASGESAYVHLQHRSSGFGALLKISGFKVNKSD